MFLYNKKVNVILLTVLKAAYSCLIFWIIYKVTNIFVINFEKLTFLTKFNEIGLYAILNVAFSIAFLVYDALVIYGYKYAKRLADKVIKNKNK